MVLLENGLKTGKITDVLKKLIKKKQQQAGIEQIDKWIDDVWILWMEKSMKRN